MKVFESGASIRDADIIKRLPRIENSVLRWLVYSRSLQTCMYGRVEWGKYLDMSFVPHFGAFPYAQGLSSRSWQFYVFGKAQKEYCGPMLDISFWARPTCSGVDFSE
jgi:hypothetical protein